MDLNLKKTLRGISLEIRRLLEGRYDEFGVWQGGDLERRLNEMGVWRDREAKPVDEMPHLSAEDKAARRLVDGFLLWREQAGVTREAAVREFVCESAYTWVNRLFALRCMEARGIIDEVILQKTAYAGRSLVHSRFARKDPAACAGEDDGLFAILLAEFEERAKDLPLLFDPKSPAVALRPSVAALKRCIAFLSGTESVRGQEPATDEVFEAPDAFGWAYQYYQDDEKKRVDDWLNTKKNFKCEGADIIPKTALYTEPYMVKFLVQNSLGAIWMGMYTDSKLSDSWEYFVKDADRAPVSHKAVREITFLDPAQGSGHFHLEAFDVFYAMYEEEAAREGRTMSPREICTAILNYNLFGIDIDGRSVQIATAALWMKAKELASDIDPTDLESFHDHLVATNIRLPKDRDQLELFLQKHPEDAPLHSALELIFTGLQHADELGSLLQIEEPVNAALRRLKQEADRNKGASVQTGLFEPTQFQGMLPIEQEDYELWKHGVLGRVHRHFEEQAQAADIVQAFFGEAAGRGLAFFDLLSRRYDVVAANPPYLGSGSHGKQVASYLDLYYRPGKSDLYSAFMLRIVQLAISGGKWAFVCPRGWLTLGTAASLRSAFKARGSTVLGLDLGTGAFEEISGEVVSVVLCVGDAVESYVNRTVRFMDLRTSSNKSADFLSGNYDAFVREHSLFDSLPDQRFSYRLTPKEVALFGGCDPLRSHSFMTIGLISGRNQRFVRYAHEVRIGARWRPYLKTQSSTRWACEIFETVDWDGSGARIRARYADTGASGGKFNGEEYYGKRGLAATRVGGGALKAQLFPEGLLFDSAASCGFSADDDTLKLCCAYLNSPICQGWAKELNDSFNYQAGDLNVLPFPEFTRVRKDELVRLVENAVSAVEQGIKCCLTDYRFAPTHFLSKQPDITTAVGKIKMILSSSLDQLALIETDIYKRVNAAFAAHKISDTGVVSQDSCVQGESGSPEIALDLFSAIALHLLGHRWPMQIEAGDSVPVWADSDGIIPLTEGCGEKSFIEQVKARLPHEFPGGNAAALDREFGKIVGVPLADWVAGPFFERHISQFKKSPIAWQIETDARGQKLVGGKRKRGEALKPAFSCLAYYHKLDAGMLPKIRTHYVGKLRAGFETELRALERTKTPTADQQGRKLLLDQWIEEMKAFDAKLELVAERGFASDSLRQLGINDAILSLTATWLRRLNEVVSTGPLVDWRNVATGTDLHPDFPAWIGEAFSRLDHFCTAVGPKPPDEKTFTEDPTSENLAPLVCASPSATVARVLILGCDRWWKLFDEAVLAPLKESLKQAREEQKRVKEELKLDEVKHDYGRNMALSDRKDELAAMIKSLGVEIDTKTAAARTLRVQIERWTCPDADGWEAWLGGQPLFDIVASMDGRRPPPVSLAEFIAQESAYAPDINDGVRVNIAPVQKAELLHAPVLDAKDLDKAIADRADWRADERRWVREGKLPQPGWWPTNEESP